MNPLDEIIHYGKSEQEAREVAPTQLELLPEKVQQLRSKLNQKAKNEPKFRFYALYDRIYRMDVLEAAWKHVGKRGKAAGVDGIKAEQLLDKEGGVKALLQEVQLELKEKRYQPSPVKRVYIEKENGGRRPLGIPTLKDRLVQMAALLILEPIFEADFQDCSYGFRAGRKAHDALSQIREQIRAGRKSVYDADLKGYFDNIAHDKLLACVRMRVSDGKVIKLIRRWLRAPIIEVKENKPQPPNKTEKGTPQGGVISPLLANIYLHWFDTMFHRKGGPYHWANARLVRYADDFVILARYQGYRIDEWVRATVEGWLGLELNTEKTKVVDLGKGERLDFLGFSFRFEEDLRGRGWKYLNITPSPKAQKKIREAIYDRTNARKCFKPANLVVEDLNLLLRGWGNYFNFGNPRKAFRGTNHYVLGRMIRHLNRRSQRKYHKPKDITHYQHMKDMGLMRL